MTRQAITLTAQDATAFLVHWLKQPNQRSGIGNMNAHDYSLQSVMDAYLRDNHGLEYNQYHLDRNVTDLIDYAFLEASWNLTRMGIIRPTMKRNYGATSSCDVGGMGITVTELGKEWLKQDSPAFGYIPSDPTRFTSLIEPYQELFGDGFFQRASEAGACWAHGTYYAACSMAGAAAESIMLAIAVQKSGDEAAVLAEYSKAGGRGAIERKITANMKPKDKQDFEAYTALLKYWRDNAAHGKAMSFTEFEAHDALSRLLRFAQFVKERWQTLTQRAANSEAA